VNNSLLKVNGIMARKGLIELVVCLSRQSYKSI